MTSGTGDGSLRALRVLVVENHPDTLAVMLRVFKGAGAEVHGAHDCATARDRAGAMGSGGPTVVVGDIGLPDGDGRDLLAELKVRYGCRTVVASGYPPTAGGSANTPDLWLKKPMTIQQILSSLAGLFRGGSGLPSR